MVRFESTKSSDKNLTMDCTSDVENDCLCCSMKSRSLLAYAISSGQSSTSSSSCEGSLMCDTLYLLCKNGSCRKRQFYKCAILFLDRIKSTIPESTWSLNPWVKEMMPYFLSSDIPRANISVTNCISCVTSAFIPKHVKTSLTNIKIPSNLPVSAYPDIEIDEELSDDITPQKNSVVRLLLDALET